MICFVIALQSEADSLLNRVENLKEIKLADKKAYTCTLCGTETVIAISGIGKVSAALTTQLLIDKYSPEYIFNFGTCGGMNESVQILKYYAIEKCCQYDFDLSELDNALTGKYWEYINGVHDLTNNSMGKFDSIKVDSSILNLNLFEEDKLYLYYNGFEIADENKQDEIISNFWEIKMAENPNILTLKKSEDINGVLIDFYYLCSGPFDVLNYASKHNQYTNFLESTVPGNVLNAIYSNSNRDEIIMLPDSVITNADTAPFGAYANWSGEIVVRNDVFFDAIRHELGHRFDSISNNNINFLGKDIGINYVSDYTASNMGKWDLLAKKYSYDVSTLIDGANIERDAEAMKNGPKEFYANVFQLYYSGDEKREALPKKVRNALEFEINKYASE